LATVLNIDLKSFHDEVWKEAFFLSKKTTKNCMNKKEKSNKLLSSGKAPAFPDKEKAKRKAGLIFNAFVGAAEQKKAEEDLAQLAAIVETSDDAIISKSLNGTIRSWNMGSEKMFGYTASEAIGKNISLIIPPDYIHEEKDIIEKISNNEIIDHYETVRNKKNGDRFYVSLTASPLKDRSGHIVGVSKIARDITSRKKLETELIQTNKELAFQNGEKEKRAEELFIANEELAFQNGEKAKRASELTTANKELVFQNGEKEKRAEELFISNRELKMAENQFKEVNKELEAFSYSVSHDLRAPLRAVIGYTSMLKEDYESKLDEEANRIIDVIVDKTNMMKQLIDDLLSFSKITRLEVVKRSIDMKRLAEKCVAEILPIETKTKYDITVLPMPACKGDASMLKQVLHNLISNAIKYSSKKENPKIEIGAIDQSNMIVYYIKDNGIGFDMRYADKLFGVFQRFHRQDEFEGTGVGLALAKRIIIKHGGEIWAESLLNEGASFYFSIPK
jgi:PAS domain S-box-containing protein